MFFPSVHCFRNCRLVICIFLQFNKSLAMRVRSINEQQTNFHARQVFKNFSFSDAGSVFLVMPKFIFVLEGRSIYGFFTTKLPTIHTQLMHGCQTNVLYAISKLKCVRSLLIGLLHEDCTKSLRRFEQMFESSQFHAASNSTVSNQGKRKVSKCS